MMNDMEIWKDIEGYPNYQVSNMGRVKSLERIDNNNHLVKEKILKGIKERKGYFLVSLWKDGEGKSFSVHRLVAQAFLDNPNNLPQVNHKNEIKDDNRVENLEYCDSKYNANYGTRNKRLSKPILQFSKTGEFIREWDSATQVEKELGIDNSSIAKCCKGQYKTVGGFIWCYAVINGFTIDINKLKKVA